MNVLFRFLPIALVFATACLANGDPRPKIGTVSNERVKYKDLGVSVLVPAGTVLIGPRPEGDAVNYAWPWLQTAHGWIDVACDGAPKGDNLKAMVTTELSHSRTKWRVNEIEEVEVNDIPMVRASIHEEANPGASRRPPYPIVRYYFLTDSKRLAFFHLHNFHKSAELEKVIGTLGRLR